MTDPRIAALAIASFMVSLGSFFVYNPVNIRSYARAIA
jgi:hypothetical protein